MPYVSRRAVYARRIRRGVLRAAIVLLLLAAGARQAVSADAPPRPALQTDHFLIAYSPSNQALARTTGDILEAAVAEFASRLPFGTERVRVELCHTGGQFRQLAGRYGLDRVGGLAEPDRSLLILRSPAILPPGSDFAGIARHELIHVLLARNTNEANVPRWFEEGVAMVLSRELRWDSALHLARMYVARRLIPYPELDISFSPAGGEETFGEAYAQALSMTQHLIKKLGEDTFWQLVGTLKTDSFDVALMRYAQWTPGDLYDTWRRTLWKLAVIASLVSGFSVFQLAALLVIIAYWRKRRSGQRLLNEWEQQEAFERAWGAESESGPGEDDEWQEDADDDDDHR